MEYRNELMSKNGLAVIRIAKEFLKCRVGEKTPTVTELSEKLSLSRGTTQSAIKVLQINQAVTIKSHGHLGSFLEHKDEKKLLEYAGFHLLVGAMPLPYSRKYEGLATGLVTAVENSYGLPITLSFMRGAKNRIAMVLANRYDFAVVSRYAALEFMKNNPNSIEIVHSFGNESYCTSHVLIFHNDEYKEIQDGMKIGIDCDSIDQSNMTKKVCKDKKVQYYPVEYSRLFAMVQSGELDATVWNEDEILEKMSSMKYVKVDIDMDDDTNAVIVTNKKNDELSDLLRNMIDVNLVTKIQAMVLEGKITPSY